MMMTLETLRDALATIPGIASCKIGLEEAITPEDYPLIRVVPSRLTPRGPALRNAEILVYYGMPVQAFDDVPDAGGRVRLEKVYAALFALEAAIIAKMNILGAVYEETITDEDRLDTYKLMAIRGRMVG